MRYWQQKWAITIVMLAWSVFPSLSYASVEPGIPIYVEGKLVPFEAPPLLLGETAIVPFRPVFEALGLAVNWDAESQAITGTGNVLVIHLQIGSSEADINGGKVRIPMAPRLIGSTTYIPLRFISEATGREVTWNGDGPSVSIGPARDLLTYEGEVKEGVREGKGKLFIHGRIFYEGEFHKGLPEGQGKKYYSSGTVMYEGGFSAGAMQGKGKMYRENGTLWYDAEFAQNNINGQGTCYFPEGHRIVGEFKDGVPHGPGQILLRRRHIKIPRCLGERDTKWLRYVRSAAGLISK